ncbi:MAG: serine hydrolase domain-containing protein [Mangrovibacterium sp.]
MNQNYRRIFLAFTGSFCLAIVLTSLLSCSKKSESRLILNKDYKKEIIEGRQAFRIYLISSSVPGMSVSVSVDGKTVWSEGIGFASKELQAPVIPETKFRIGGTSRMLTAFLIARLQQEGKLKVSDSFYKYIPDFPRKQWDFSVSQLGTHSAGFAGENDEQLLKSSKEHSTLKDYVKAFSNDSLQYRPDSYFILSDYGFCLLGIMAEEITQKKFQALMKEMVLDTLGLEETTVDNPFYLINQRAQPYYQNYIAQLMNAPPVNLGFCAPSKGFLSTADDLNKAGQAILDTTFFSRESLDLFVTPHKLGDYETNLGFGWWILRDQEGRTFYAQTGSTIGGSSMLLVYPDTRLVVSICSNIAEEPGRMPGEQIANIFLKKLDPQQTEGKKNPGATDDAPIPAEAGQTPENN